MPFYFHKRIQSLFHPERFQGWGKEKNYFEGWYFKMVTENGNDALAIIPGIAMDEQGNNQAFIQVLDGKRKTAEYHRFPFESFTSSKKSFKNLIITLSLNFSFLPFSYFLNFFSNINDRIKCSMRRIFHLTNKAKQDFQCMTIKAKRMIQSFILKQYKSNYYYSFKMVIVLLIFISDHYSRDLY